PAGLLQQRKREALTRERLVACSEAEPRAHDYYLGSSEPSSTCSDSDRACKGSVSRTGEGAPWGGDPVRLRLAVDPGESSSLIGAEPGRSATRPWAGRLELFSGVRLRFAVDPGANSNLIP